MYEEFRLDVLRELTGQGFDDEALFRIMGAIDKAGTEYDVERKQTALVPMEALTPRLLVEYLAVKSIEGRSKNTIDSYGIMLRCFFRRVQKPVNEIESADIRLYLFEYQQVRKISNRALDKMRSTICGFFKWAAAEGRLEKDPGAAIRPIKHTKKPRTALTQLELEYIRTKCYNARERAIVELLYSTGCRVSELISMKKSDVDWGTQTVGIWGKGGKYRTGFINAKALVALEMYLASRDDDDEHLIVSERKPHTGLSRFGLERIISEISKRANHLIGKNVTPHVFRHTTATVAVQNGMPIQNVSKLLGHSQVETTMIYAEIDTLDVKRDHTRFVI